MLRTYKNKSSEMIQLINDALSILDVCGIPMENMTDRAKEKMAMTFLSVANVFSNHQWQNAKSINDGVKLKTREIITLINQNFNESISYGSYDDIRRKDLKYPVLAFLIVNTSPNSARNDPNRGYALSQEMCELVKTFNTPNWENKLQSFKANYEELKSRLEKERELNSIPVMIGNKSIKFSPGEHNELQKAIIEEFLPRFGYGCEVLYVGDTADKYLFLEEEKLKNLNFFELSHGELPDVVAYSKEKNWLYLIEAYHSTGPMSDTRVLKLKELLTGCKCELIFITAFLDKATFKKQASVIAWETEAWIADEPDHMIHFNGDKFLGPHK